MLHRFEDLVDRGFLAPHFLQKMASDPSEILQFLRQNRAVVGEQLTRRLALRPSPEILEQQGYVPHGYFTSGHEKAMAKRHRRRSTAGQDLAMMIKLRPSPQDVMDKGIVLRETQQIEDDIKDDLSALDDGVEVYQISVLSTLLFKTIADALKRACIEAMKQENAVLQEMQVLNLQMKELRDNLDRYMLSNTLDIQLYAAEEDKVREHFHSIQTKLHGIQQKQVHIRDKLNILYSVDKGMKELQNVYDREVDELRQKEEALLHDLKASRARRQHAVKVMGAERSHHDWARAKLAYNKEVAVQMMEREGADGESAQLVAQFESFLDGLQKVSRTQQQIVDDYDRSIESVEHKLQRIRHDAMKMRTMTFKKIYDLHREVELAESLDLNNRRLSVASATELERERRHFKIKIQRQIATLNNQIENELGRDQMAKYEKRLEEMVDIQRVMSDSKSKAFFAVFVQSAMATLIDIELMFRHLLTAEQPQVTDNGVTTTEHLQKIDKLCQSLYGVHSVIHQIRDTQRTMTLRQKLTHCMRFAAVLKRAIGKQFGVKRIATHRLHLVIIFVARKLVTNEHMVDEIERTHDQQIPRLAEIRSKDIFQAVISDRTIFRGKRRMPKNIKEASHRILHKVYGIRC